MRTWTGALGLCALLGLAETGLNAGRAEAEVLCASRAGHLRIREVCQRHEREVDPTRLGRAGGEEVPLEDWPIEIGSSEDGLESISSNAAGLNTVPPCRLIETRPGLSSALAGDDIGPFATNTLRTYTIAGFCGIPTGATAASLNISVVPQPGAGGGFATAGPGGTITPPPGFATLTYLLSGPAISNADIVPLNASGQIDIYVAVPANIVVDTNGYFTVPTDASSNTGVGAGAMAAISSGTNNSAFGSGALAINDTGGSNTAVGAGSLILNDSGTLNTALGEGALGTNSSANANTAVGENALALSNGFGNTAAGQNALGANTSGTGNVAIGQNAAPANADGHRNVAIGQDALLLSDSGDDNTAIGDTALAATTSGNNNVAIGAGALGSATGSSNVAVGPSAGGLLVTGDSNIYVGSVGAATESSTIRIGDLQSAAFLAGVDGGSVDQNVPVLVGTDGRLGTMVSSNRALKEDIRDIAERSDGVLDLRPVSFRYRAGNPEPQFGLIAEEVAETMPELVQHGPDGKLRGIRYDRLTPLLLNELIKARRLVDQQQETIDTLNARVARLEETTPAP